MLFCFNCKAEMICCVSIGSIVADLVEEANANNYYDDENSVGCEFAKKIVEIWKNSFS